MCERVFFDVMPEMTGRELKQQIKEAQLTWDEATSRTTAVEILVGERLLGNDERVVLPDAELEELVVNIVFKPNIMTCSDKHATYGSREMDPNLLLVVEIPDHEIRIAARGFPGLRKVCKIDHPKLSDPHWRWCLSELPLFGKLGPSQTQ